MARGDLNETKRSKPQEAPLLRKGRGGGGSATGRGYAENISSRGGEGGCKVGRFGQPRLDG